MGLMGSFSEAPKHFSNLELLTRHTGESLENGEERPSWSNKETVKRNFLSLILTHTLVLNHLLATTVASGELQVEIS